MYEYQVILISVYCIVYRFYEVWWL